MFGLFEEKKVFDVTADEVIKEMDIIRNISSRITSNLNLEEVLQTSVDEVVTKMGYFGALIFLVDGGKNIVRSKTVSQTWYTKIALKIIPQAFDALYVSLDKDRENYIVKTIIDKKEYYSKRLSDFIVPAVSLNIADTMQTITGHRSGISVPLIDKGECIGAVMFTKKSEDDFQKELPILRAFSDILAISISNAGLFSRIKSQVNLLELKNQDLQSLYNLTSQISKSLDPATVAQTAVNSLPQDKFIVGAIVAEHTGDGNSLQNIALTENAIYFQVTKIINDPKQYKLEIDSEDTQFNLAVKAFKQGVPQYTNELKDFLSPTLPGPLISAVEAVLKIKSVASYPLIIRGKAIGTLTFLIKEKSAEELTESEKQLLGTYTYHITIALENAELYKQQKLTQANLETALAEVQALRQHEQDMIDIMGHELRTPISIVRNALGMLELELKNTGEIKKDNLAKFLDISMESARREVKLVETLLSSAKADSRGFQLLFEKVDFLDVINDSLEFFTKEAEKKQIQIKYTKPTEDIFVYADRTRIQEVMDNLLSNAVKYTDRGFIKINVRVEDDFAWIEVADTGIGMSEEDLKSIGQKFYRVDQYMDNGPAGVPKDEKPNIIRPGGTGLGLYVTFSLAKVMDGKIDVKSQLGVGSTFSFAMPLYKGQESKQEQRKP